MKTGEKLKLLRALNGLSQEELGLMFGGSRELCALIESEKKLWVAERAECLTRTMHVDADWLMNEENMQVLGSTGFALFVFDGEKKVGATQSSQTKFINSALKTVENFLAPAISGATYCCIGQTDGLDSALILFNLHGHGLLVKVVKCADMVLAITAVARNLTGISVDMKQISDSAIQLVDYSNPDAIVGFINQANIDENWKTGIASLVKEQSEYLNIAGKKAKRGKMSPVTAGEARILYAKSVYETQVSRIAQDMVDNGIKLADLAAELRKIEKFDLL